jgi:Fibronectin type III domain
LNLINLVRLVMNAVPAARIGNMMTDSEHTAQDPPVASTPAAPWIPATPQDPVTAHDPATVALRRRRRWAVFTLAAVVVLGLAAGLVVWAPWVPAPVLRPTGLAAGSSTANSIEFRWSRPPTGPLPDKYLILSDGAVAASVAGTVTSYRQAGLVPAITYQYHVVAVRAGKRSPQSALLTVRTLTPPISQARLQGPWNVYAKNTGPARSSRSGPLSLQFSPVCAAGACDVILHGQDGVHSFKMKLTRAGAVYKGQTVANLGRCGPPANSIPDPITLKLRIRVVAATGENQVWAATSLAGTMVGTSQHVSSSAFYCPAFTYTASLTGSSA